MQRISMTIAYGSSIRFWIEAPIGNKSDKVSFRKSIKEYRQQFKKSELPYFVADSALYTKDSIAELDGVKWVTRVPEIISEAKEQILSLDREKMTDWGKLYLAERADGLIVDRDFIQEQAPGNNKLVAQSIVFLRATLQTVYLTALRMRLLWRS